MIMIKIITITITHLDFLPIHVNSMESKQNTPEHDLQGKTVLILHSSFIIPYSSFSIHLLSFIIKHFPFLIPHSSFIIHPSSFIIHHFSFLIQSFPFLYPPPLLYGGGGWKFSRSPSYPPCYLSPSEDH